MNEAQSLARQEQAIAQPISYNKDQLQLIKDIYAKGTTDQEFKLFVETSVYRGLDIFKGQICLIGFKDKKLEREVFQPVVKVDGYLSLAERTGEYEGQTPAEWCGKDGIWKDVWLEDVPPAAAKVGVYRRGFRVAMFAVARFASYAASYPDGNLKGQWKTMPDVMIAKCARSLALRLAFPEQLGGLYTQEEMEQAQNEPRPVGSGQKAAFKAEIPSSGPADPAEKTLDELLTGHCVALKGNRKAGEAYFKAIYGKKSFEEKQAAALDLGLVKAEEPVTVDVEIVEKRETAEI